MHKTEVRVPENMQNDVEKRERRSYVHARKNAIDIIKKVMNKLLVGILIASVLIGILTVIPENVRAETWSIETVDSVGGVVRDTSIALDSNNNPHISYYDDTNGDLKYAKWTGSAWSKTTVDYSVGYYTSITLDSNIYPHISYSDGVNRHLKYAKLMPDVPTRPMNLKATAGDEYVYLSWDAPDDDGGAEIKIYRIYRGRISGGESLHAAVDNLSSYTDEDDVINDRTYYYQVSAVNSAGEGEKSNEVDATPTSDVTTPSAPQKLTSSPGDRKVKLGWDMPRDDGGTPVTGYMIYRGNVSEGEKTRVETVGDVVRAYTDENVINNQTYYYQVRAVNSVGEGEKSEEVPATPTSGVTTPSAPEKLQTRGGNGYVELSWDMPRDDGGTPVTGYKIYSSNTSRGEKTPLTTVGNVLIYTDKNVTNEQTYYYQVSAVNSVGEGIIKSNEASATPKKEYDWVLIAALIGAAAAIIAAIINYLVSRKRRYGSISASSKPDGARVFLDGVDKGESPLTMDKIRKGTHIVLFSKSGYSDCKKEVVVNADQTTTVHCDLKKHEMKLRLSAEPNEIPADGKSKSVITMSVEDENGTPAPVPEEMTIVLETDIGLIDTPVRIPAGDVSATSILTSSTAGGTATVRAKSEVGLEISVAVRFV